MLHLRHITVFSSFFLFINISTADDFRIVDPQSVEFTNPYRANAKLKIIFMGGNITHTDHRTKSTWSLVMDYDSKNPTGKNVGHNIINVRNTSRVSVNDTPKSSFYSFSWYHSNKEYPDQEICFDLSFNGASWYSTALEKDQPWPYNTGKPFSGPNNSAVALKTGSYETTFGPVVDNVYLNSDGFALLFSQYYPDMVVRKTNQLCTTIHPDHHDPNDKLHYASIGFDLFASEDVAKMHHLLLDRYFVIGRESPKGATADERMFSHPTFTFDAKTLKQAEVLAKVNELSKVYGLKNLQIVFEGWEKVMGDLKFDGVRFPEPAAMVAEIHKLGYLVKLTVNSFYDSTSNVFKIHPHFFISDPKNRSLPFTFSWKNPQTGSIQTGSLFNYPASTGALYNARDWLVDRLKDFQRFEKVDSFRFVGGDLGQFGVPENVRTDSMKIEHFSNEYTKYYSAAGNWLGGLVDLDAAYHSQNWKNFIRMRDIPADWTSLGKIIPQALTMGLAGYDYLVAPSFTSKPTEELYIRWLQLTTFFPSMQLSSVVGDLSKDISSKAENLTYTYLNFHSEHSATMISVAKATSKSGGGPLLRPLWYITPNDPKTYPIADQFALGNDIIVAPVLTAGAKERSVYLPSGTWIDQHGKSYTGPIEVKVLAPLEELPYFKRKIA